MIVDFRSAPSPWEALNSVCRFSPVRLCRIPIGNSRVVSRTTVPEGQRESSPAFQRREERRKNLSPEGTAERVRGRAIFQPSLRDFNSGGIHPSVETLGYFHSSLRDIHFRITNRHYG